MYVDFVLFLLYLINHKTDGCNCTDSKLLIYVETNYCMYTCHFTYVCMYIHARIYFNALDFAGT